MSSRRREGPSAGDGQRSGEPEEIPPRVPSRGAEESPWAPLSRPMFRALWIASLASQVGTWMHDIGAAWLMTSLASAPLLVALVQTASTAPLFALAIPAGALADIVDRRKLLLTTQLWMLGTAGSIASLTFLGIVTPAILLALTASLAIGAAFNAPAWQATTPDLVPRAELPAAVALNGMAINLSRTVGPALGGIAIGLLGPAAPFALNAVSFLGVVFVLACWRREPSPRGLPTEQFAAAMRAGLRYARHAQGFRSVLARAALFLFPASALWALLPLLARGRLELGPTGYGVLVGSLGFGAVVGTWLLPSVRRKLSNNTYTALATTVVALSFAALSAIEAPIAAVALLAVMGVAWITMLSSINVAAQAGATDWVRGRALSVFLVFFFGSFALGSTTWGAIASRFSVESSLLLAAFSLIAGLPLIRVFSLASTEGLDLVPSLHWPAPSFDVSRETDSGPVLVTVEYRVPIERRTQFLGLLFRLRGSRLRDGAFCWGVYQDPETPDQFVEVFYAASWIEHLRHHQRVTKDDARLQAAISGIQTLGYEPRVTHRIAVRAGPTRSRSGVDDSHSREGRAEIQDQEPRG